MKITKIMDYDYDLEKEVYIGNEIECSCGCKRRLRCFLDLENPNQFELVMVDVFVTPSEDKWKNCFIISNKDLMKLKKRGKEE